MSSYNPYPPFGSSLREVKYQLWSHGSGSYYWGFYVYRTTYDEQELWERYLSYIYSCIDNQLKFESESDRERLRRHFRLTVIEDPTLANVSTEHVRERFTTWVSSLPDDGDPQQEVPLKDHRDPIRFSYPLYVDSECLNSLRAHDEVLEKTGYEWQANRLVFIKAINAEQPLLFHSDVEVENENADDETDENEEEDEIEREDETEEEDETEGEVETEGVVENEEEDENEEEEENDDHEEVEDDPEFYWMLVTCRYLGVYWETMGRGGQWKRQSSSSRYPQKRPWKET